MHKPAHDPFAHWLGIKHLSCSTQQASCAIQLAAQHHNALGGVHGALLFALADCAFAAACNAGQGVYIGLQAEMRYMNRVQGQVLTATASLMGSSRKLCHYQVLITDDTGQNIALFTASAYRMAD